MPKWKYNHFRHHNQFAQILFHLEVEEHTVQDWGEIPTYAEALWSAMGPEGLERLKMDCKKEMANFNNNAERVYLNWMQTSART